MPSELTPGAIVANKLRIIRQLGAGGMGVVYEAEQMHLARHVALKLIHPAESESADARARFIREARALARLPLEHIVQVLDVDTLPDGGLYMVMEYLEGRDLKRELFKRGPLPVGEAVGYIVQACEGVAAAHDAGIVHRDLKPQNLFVTNLEGKRRVKLLDFGVAKMLEVPDQSLTRPSALLGTPLYMSPEQLSGGQALDGRSDLWALGIVLYELLTGTTPFRRESAAATLAAVLVDSPGPLREERRDVPEELELVVRRCLAKDPKSRFATARDLAAALAPYASPDSSVSRSKQAPRGSSAPPVEQAAASPPSGRPAGTTRRLATDLTSPSAPRAAPTVVDAGRAPGPSDGVGASTVISRRPGAPPTRAGRTLGAPTVAGLAVLTVVLAFVLFQAVSAVLAVAPRDAAPSAQPAPRAARPSAAPQVPSVASKSAAQTAPSSRPGAAPDASERVSRPGAATPPAGPRAPATASVPVASAAPAPSWAGDSVPLHL